MNNDEQNKIDKMIDDLSDRLEPVKVIKPTHIRAFVVFVLSVVYVTVVTNFFLDMRFDLKHRLQDFSFLFEVVYVLLICFLSFYAAAKLSLPDVRHVKWYVLSPVLMVVLGAVLLLAQYISHDLPLRIDISRFSYHHCMLDGLFLVSLPVLICVFLVRRGATTHPYLAAMVSSIGGGMMGWLGLRMGCGSNDISHLFFAHFLPFFIIAFVPSLLARKIFRW